MDFKQLQSFQAVVQYRSFTEAAEQLQISQPTISTHIRMLEEELHSCLVIRTTKSLEITPRGWEVYACASNILSLKENLIKSFSRESRKVIHLGASTIPSAYILPEILPEFGRKFPDVYFVVDQSDSQKVIEAVHNGVYDVGLVGMKCEDELLDCISFYEDEMVLITPVKEPYLSLEKKEDTALELLQTEPVILRENGSGSQKSADVFLKNMGISEESLHVTARMNDQESIKNLVAGGLGISVISKKAVENFLAEKRLLKFELPGDAVKRKFYIIYQKNYVLKEYVKAFVEYVERDGEKKHDEITKEF